MRIFITGISSGIGRDLAIQLTREGHEVWGIARRQEALLSLEQVVDSPLLRFDICDITDNAANKRVHEKMLGEGFTPDAVILNAAVDLEDELPGLDVEQSEQMMRTNLDGAFFWLSAFIEPFQQRGSGQFVAVSSLFSHWPDKASVSYSASKAALSMLFRGLRIRYSGSGIYFKIINLGPVDTPINPRFQQGMQQDSLVVASSSDTGAYIAAILKSKRSNFYFPFYVGLVMIFLRWLPDRIFELVTAPFKR